MIQLRTLSTSLLFAVFIPFISAQKTAAYTDKDALFKQGLELYDKKQYVVAQKNFDLYRLNGSSSLLKEDAAFYAAVCAIELFNKDGEWLMREFIREHPENPKVNNGFFFLGKSNFRKKKYKETIDFLDKVDPYRLDKEQLAEYYFKRGYSHFINENNEKAKIDLHEIKDVDNKYAYPAQYYYSHIAYEEKNYETALTGFNKLVGNETFGGVVPYYITQIYFTQGKFDKVISEGPKLLEDSANVQKRSEINRMIGESYFNRKEYANALPYLKEADMGSGPQGNYAIGYCYYKTDDCQKAIFHLEKATDDRDSLSQNAWYHMADCYVKLKDKLKAKNAYYSAYQINYDKKITEDALFSFARLSYELDFSPYNEAVKAFTKYLKEYPNSTRKEECYNFLVNVYSTTKNYDLAIQSIESMGTIDPILKITYQKLIYFRGVEFFNNGDNLNAEKQFKKSLALNSDLKLSALSQYWLGEVSYLRKDYTTALEIWKKFQLLEGASALKEYDLSNYAIGYAYFHRKERSNARDNDDYANANISFRKFLLTKNVYEPEKINDATIRSADCYFMNNDFAQASEYYKKAIDGNTIDADYALYQKALCDGLNKRYTEKIAELKKIESRYPKSNYLIASMNEIADTYYRNLKDEENAIGYYKKIIQIYPNSSITHNSYAQLGNIYFGRKEDDKAFEYYDKFVSTDTKSDAAKDIMEAIRKIFQAKGDIAGMEKYFAEKGNPLSENQIEKELYTVAYDAFYTQKDCNLALPKWELYIQKFPEGKNINEAQFQAAECNYEKNNTAKALDGYLFVTKRQRSLYSEQAYAKAAYLYYKDKKYAEALPLFQQLQDIAETPSNKTAARLGAMRSSFYLKQYEVALEEVIKVLNTEKLNPQQLSETRYIKAKSLFETNRLDDAMIEFKQISKSAKNVTGAEAWYHVALIHFKKQDYKEVERSVNKLIGYEYSNSDWNNKGMLLLADAYLAKGEDADAKVILQTIIEGKPKQEYIDEAAKRLDELNKKEARAKEENSAGNTEMKVDFKGNKNDEDLFDKMYKEYEQKKSVPQSTVTPQEPK